MNTKRNKAALRRLYEAFFNEGDVAVAEALIAVDCLDHEHYPGTDEQGIAGVTHLMHLLHRAFPDFHIVIDDMIAEGDRVAARVTMNGTHQGDFLGVPPTGRRINVPVIDFVRFADEKMVEHWAITDTAQLMAQLGVAEPA